MSRQPTQRSLFEQLRTGSEVMRTTEIKASDTLAQRTTEARIAGEAARTEAGAAQTAAGAASASANAALATATAASNAASAAQAATAAANAAVATANVSIAELSRSTVAQVVTANDEVSPDTTWNTKPGLTVSGPWGGLIAVVRVSVPCDSTGAPAITRRQYFELRRDGVAVAYREVTQMPSTMTMTFAEKLTAGSHDYTLWWRSGGDGFIGASGDDSLVPRRAMTVTLVAG